MTGTVQQLVAVFENMSTEDNCGLAAPASSISVKQLVAMFESKLNRTQVDEEEVEHTRPIRNAKKTDVAVQADHTCNDGSKRTINTEPAAMKDEHPIQENGIKKWIAMFENMAYAETIEDSANRMLETAPSKFKEEREDGPETVNPTSDHASESDMEIEANVDLTEKRTNPFIFHVNAPASTPGPSARTQTRPVKQAWRKLSVPRLLVMIARGSKFEGGRERGSRTTNPTSSESLAEKSANRLLETAPLKFEEEREKGSRIVPSTSPDLTTQGDLKTEANVDQTEQGTNPFIFHINVPASIPGTSASSKTRPAKKAWRKLSMPRLLVMLSTGLRVCLKNRSKTKDINIPVAPVQVTIPIPPSDGPGEAKNIEISLSVTSVSFK